jgi:hypothetical protein
LKILLNGLSDTVKTSIGLCTSTKDLWLKLENMYQIKKEEYSDIEAEVNLEAELESALDELRKYKQSCKQLKDQLKTVEKFKKGTEALDKVLSLQRSPSNKFDLGYDHAHIIKGSNPITQIDVEDGMSSNDNSKEPAHPPKKTCIKSKEKTQPSIKVKTLHNILDGNNVDIKISSASKEEDSDTITECFVSIYPMEEEEEKLSKAKEKVDWSLSEYLYHHNESDYSYLHDYTQEYLEKSQKHVLKINQMLKDSDKIIYEQDNQLEEKEEEIEKLKKEISQVKEKEKEDDELGNQKHILEIKEKLKYNKEIISEKKIQLENKEDEIKRLKTKVVDLTEENEEKIKRLKNEISQAKEEKKEDDVSRKNIADLKELRENYVNLKIQLEEAKRREEVVRNQLDKKEESCHELEAEVVNLRKKVEKSDTQNKFLNNSMTLDEILDSQRSPNDKSGLGYNKEEINTPKKSDAGPSFVKGENKSDTSPSLVKDENRSDTSPSFAKDEDRSDTTPSFAKSESRYDSGSSRSRNKSNTTKFRRSDHGRHPEAIHRPQSKFRRETPSWMNQRRYESIFNGYCFSCNVYGHKALDCRHHGRKQVGRFNNNIRCWNCTYIHSTLVFYVETQIGRKPQNDFSYMS